MNLEQLVGNEYTSLNDVSKGLFNELVTLVEPGADNRDFKAAKLEVMKASKALRTQYSRYAITDVDGMEAVDRFEDAAKIYLEGSGSNIEGGDKKRYASMMRNMLGKENLSAAMDAIKKGDVDELAKLFKDAYVGERKGADIQSVASKIMALASDDKVKFGQAAAKLVGGNDYFKVMTDLPGYIQALKQVSSIREAYTSH